MPESLQHVPEIKQPQVKLALVSAGPMFMQDQSFISDVVSDAGLDIKRPPFSNSITRRQTLKILGGTALAFGSRVFLRDRAIAAELLDGGDSGVEAPTNPTATAIAEYEGLAPDEITPYLNAAPRFKFHKDFPPQNQSFRLDFRGSDTGVYLGRDDDPMTPYPHLGITSPLNIDPKNEGSTFRFTGKLVGDVVSIPFKSEDPNFHEALTAHFAPMGFADGDPLTGEVSKGVLPVFLYLTGEEGSQVPWVNRLAIRQTLGPDTIFDGREAERTDHKLMPLAEIIAILNNAKNNTVVSMQLNNPVANDNLYQAYKDIGWPMDLFEHDYQVKQTKKINSIYRNILQRHAFVMAKRQGYSLWTPLDGTNVAPVPFSEIFTDKYREEDPEVILGKLPKMDDLLDKKELTAQDILRIPPATMLDLIKVSNSLA